MLFIPVLWITVALFMYSERGSGPSGSGPGGGGSGGSAADSGPGVRSRGARRDLSENVNRDALAAMSERVELLAENRN